MTGAVVSTTCTTNEVGVAVFPFESVAVQVTGVFPSGKRLPDVGEQEATPGPSTMSEVAGLE